MNDHEGREDDLNATSTACLLAALRNDIPGLAMLLDDLPYLELRYTAYAAFVLAADLLTRGNDPLDQERVDALIEEMKTRVAEMRMKASDPG